jgi:hypothetical protein
MMFYGSVKKNILVEKRFFHCGRVVGFLRFSPRKNGNFNCMEIFIDRNSHVLIYRVSSHSLFKRLFLRFEVWKTLIFISEWIENGLSHGKFWRFWVIFVPTGCLNWTPQLFSFIFIFWRWLGGSILALIIKHFEHLLESFNTQLIILHPGAQLQLLFLLKISP